MKYKLYKIKNMRVWRKNGERIGRNVFDEYPENGIIIEERKTKALQKENKMEAVGMLDELQRKALRDETLRRQLLDTRTKEDPLFEFCRICQNQGYELYPMDVIAAGEDFYASMRRSTNGGGENSPLLDGEDDFYELFLAALEA